ncbi:uncharacterized protein [Apostichopus japonicus]|uniref:uncharacterized protein n=1 Tax=Stichopus japonicus TaxID=307972 RepID=UPI003AB6425A
MAELRSKCFFVFVVLLLLNSNGFRISSSTRVNDSNLQYFLFQTPEYPRDCHEVLNQCSSTNAKSGVYLIKPDQYPEPFQTYCDQNTTSGGWTVIQRRLDGSIGFNRTWDEYKNGIGFLGSEFLIGNEKLAHLINQKRYQLLIELENYAGQSYSLTYDNFRIADEWGNYSITSLGVVEGITDLPITWCSSNKDNYDNTCERTCENPNDCVIPNPADPERCLCPENHMVLGDNCIPQEQCGCYVEKEGVVLAEGESYINSDCSLRITCNSNNLTSESYSCSADATCEERNDVRRCYCNEWFEGDGLTCTRSGPIDCSDLYAANRTNNGAYTIYPAGNSGFEVYCEMSSGGWTILQRRTSSSVNFYQNWNEYKNGFGILTGDHWIGNDKIYSLTKQTNTNYELLIEKTNTEGSTYHSRYSSFSISNEGDKYQLSLGDYDGNAGNNAMGANSGHRFSTHDQDNDGSSTFDCAEKHRGGWWYADDSSTGSTSNCYSFSDRVATGGYEYSDCYCCYYYYCYYYYYYCYNYCFYYYYHYKCYNCDGCSGTYRYRKCRNKNPVYATTFYSCGYSNLNGDYSYNDNRGIFWTNLHGSDCGITATTMKIRPSQ